MATWIQVLMLYPKAHERRREDMERFGGQGSGEYGNTLKRIQLKLLRMYMEGLHSEVYKEDFLPRQWWGHAQRQSGGVMRLAYCVLCIICINNINLLSNILFCFHSILVYQVNSFSLL